MLCLRYASHFVKHFIIIVSFWTHNNNHYYFPFTKQEMGQTEIKELAINYKADTFLQLGQKSVGLIKSNNWLTSHLVVPHQALPRAQVAEARGFPVVIILGGRAQGMLTVGLTCPPLPSPTAIEFTEPGAVCSCWGRVDRLYWTWVTFPGIA